MRDNFRMGIEFWVEGPSEARIECTPGRKQAREASCRWEGAVPPIIERIMAEAGATVPLDPSGSKVRYWKNIHRRFRGMRGKRKPKVQFKSPLARKTFLAVQKHVLDGEDLPVVALWDTDGKPERRAARDEVIEKVRDEKLDGIVVGVYERQVEAWLLVDKDAFSRAFGCQSGQGTFPGSRRASLVPRRDCREP